MRAIQNCAFYLVCVSNVIIDLSTREAKQALIDGFVNAIYLYDDHAKLILNYKNDTKTITLDELQGSDFNSVTAPERT